MTYGDIYDKVIIKCWGQAVAPTIAPEHIREIIVSIHRKIQRQYNFWFNLYRITMSTIIGQREYALPDLFKEIERCNFTVLNQAFTTEPLISLDLMADIDEGFTASDASTEYPTHYLVDGSSIFLYPTPDSVRTLNIVLWKFLAEPDITNVATFTAYEDAISIYCADAVIFRVLSELKLEQDEVNSSQLYMSRYLEEMQDVMMEDRRKRQQMEARANRL